MKEELPLTEILSNIYVFFYKKLKTISVFILVGMIFGGVYYFTRGKIYGAKAEICSRLVIKDRIEQKLLVLQGIINNQDYLALAQALNQPEEHISSIKSLEIILPNSLDKNKEFKGDLESKESCLVIDITSDDANHKEWVSSALLNFIKKEAYFQQVEQIAKNRNSALLKIYKRELVEIDTLQDALFQVIKNSKSSESIELLLSNYDLDAAQMAGRIEDLKEAENYQRSVYYTSSFSDWHILKDNSHAYVAMSIVFAFGVLGVVVGLITYMNSILKSNGQL